ncbi:type II secretion system protein, partial [bacterium]|nr:type II secretion system protein [bacterium]
AKDTLCIGALLHRRQIFDWKHHALVLISYVKNLRNRRSLLVPLRGFTLAEVLITLGIIGVVAALTIPTLILNNNKRIVETRLAKFYSNINQAIELSEVENGPKEKWDKLVAPTGEEASVTNRAWFDKYLNPYLKTSDIYVKNGLVYILFPDGSGMYLSSYSSSFFPKPKYFDDPNGVTGKDYFSFLFAPDREDQPYHYKKGVEPFLYSWDGNRETLFTNPDYKCTPNGGAFCTELIRQNGWKIPDDYPIKF